VGPAVSATDGDQYSVELRAYAPPDHSTEPPPAPAPKSAGQADVVHEAPPSNDQPATITPFVAVAASMKLHVSFAAE
jgi:hypothetical protein